MHTKNVYASTCGTHTGTERAPAGSVCGSGHDPVKSLQEINIPASVFLDKKLRRNYKCATWGSNLKMIYISKGLNKSALFPVPSFVLCFRMIFL